MSSLNANNSKDFVDPVKVARPCGDNSFEARDVCVFYGEKQALFDVNLDIVRNRVTSLIGPSGCGKSTFLRCLNRMNDTIPICRVTGSLRLDGVDIHDRNLDVVHLRARSAGFQARSTEIHLRKCLLRPAYPRHRQRQGGFG